MNFEESVFFFGKPAAYGNSTEHPISPQSTRLITTVAERLDIVEQAFA